MDLCDDVIREIVSFLRVDLDVLALACCSKQFYNAIFEYDDTGHLDYIVDFGNTIVGCPERINVPELRKLADSYPDWYYCEPPTRIRNRPSVFIGIRFHNKLTTIPGDIFILCVVPRQNYLGVHLVECEMKGDKYKYIELCKCVLYNRCNTMEIDLEHVSGKDLRCAGYIPYDYGAFEVKTLSGFDAYPSSSVTIIMGGHDAEIWGDDGTIIVGDECFMFDANGKNRKKIRTVDVPIEDANENCDTLHTLNLFTEDWRYIKDVKYYTY